MSFRARTRLDGIPTRSDMQFWTDAEFAIDLAVKTVEAVGASAKLTEAVNLLAKARDAVADHVEGVT